MGNKEAEEELDIARKKVEALEREVSIKWAELEKMKRERAEDRAKELEIWRCK